MDTEEFWPKRLSDLAARCFARDIPTFSDFLNLHEQSVFDALCRSDPAIARVSARLDGGYGAAERKIACFFPKDMSDPATSTAALPGHPQGHADTGLPFRYAGEVGGAHSGLPFRYAGAVDEAHSGLPFRHAGAVDETHSDLPFRHAGAVDEAHSGLPFHYTGAVDAAHSGLPLGCVRVDPAHEKFAQALSHRDYLGAVLHLGIERPKNGDILTVGHGAVIICREEVSVFIASELEKVNHTQVRCRVDGISDFDYSPKTETTRGNVQSERLDALVAMFCGVSRSKAADLVDHEKVFINSRLTTSKHATPEAGDIVSVRGEGRFRYNGPVAHSKKGRLFVELERFV
ncbi:MAG: hypothetical protein LBR77_11005 [Lachnospiraceae bacterium]|jgi:RNA-binding protein YlmH|nr:hypothetical protein [Lachnospiraceae bacterium]